MRHHQRGLGLLNLILWGIAIFFAIITFAKILPAYMEYIAVKRIFATMVADPNLSNATPTDIRQSYARRAGIDDITDVQPGDLQIDQSNGHLSLSASYRVEKPILGNVGIYINFNPSTP